MADSKKRKIGYVDRAQTLANNRKMPNIAPNTTAVVCQRDRKYTFACKFKHKLTVPGNDSMLDAIVLENGICVLIAKQPTTGATKVEFLASLSTEGVSGRLKKGAQNLKAGTRLCTVTIEDGTEVQLSIPVGGKLLELNDKIIANPTLLETSHDNTGYVAVIYPDTEIPSLDVDYATLMQACTAKALVKGVCFDFQQGSCARGDSCRFKHKAVDTV
jgi:glycine cleavage system H lipoate-binding protein